MNDVTVVQPREARGLSFATVAVAFAGAVAMADAAVETFASGSPFRAWAAGAAAAYLIVAAVGLRRRSGWRVQTTLLIIALLGLLAATAWLPGGSNNGVRFAGQPTARVLSGVVAGGLLVAIAAILRAAMLPLAARLLLVLPAIYGAAAFMVGAYRTTAFGALFAGESWWLAAPRWLQGGVVGGLVVLPLAVLLSVASWFARGRRSGMLQQTLALVLSEVIVLSGLVGLQRVPPAATGAGPTQAAAGSVGAQTAAPAAEPQATADAIALIKQVATDPAAAPPDIDRKAAEIGNDPAALFAFVHDHIRTQVYSGVLRGARGVLTGGAGNAWDQSLLLAAMLKHHGRDVRFARAHLADADAAKIVARMFADAARPRPSPPSIAVSPALQRESRALLQRVRTTWQQSYADVLGALKQGGLTLGDRAVTPQMLASEAADHVWVEYRDGDRWTPLDPVGADRPGVAVASAAETFAQVPDSLYHHVTIRVTAEVRHGQQLETKDVLRYQTTAEALHEEQVFLWHYFDHDIAGRWRARPLLAIGDQVYGAMKISAAGLVSAAPPRNDLIAQAHQAVGKDQLGQVTDLFKADDAKPAASSAGELSAERLEVDFADPSGHVDTVRRDLLDRIGIAARVAGTAGTAPLSPIPTIENLPAPLLTALACAFTAGPLDPSSVLRPLGARPEGLDAAVAMRKESVNGRPTPETSKDMNEIVRGLPAVLEASAAMTFLMSQRLATTIREFGNAFFYEASPRLAIASAGLNVSADGRTVTPSLALDLRRDVMRVVGSEPAPALVQANVARGLLDGVIEDTVLREAPSSAGAISTVAVMDHARLDHVPLLLLRDVGAIGKLTVSLDARSRMVADAQKGFALVTADKPVHTGDSERAGWWRIEPSTGETVGMIDTGLHGSQLAGDTVLAETVDIPAAEAIGGFESAQTMQAQVVYMSTEAPSAVAFKFMFAGFSLGVLVSGAAIFAAAYFATK